MKISGRYVHVRSTLCVTICVLTVILKCVSSSENTLPSDSTLPSVQNGPKLVVTENTNRSANRFSIPNIVLNITRLLLTHPRKHLGLRGNATVLGNRRELFSNAADVPVETKTEYSDVADASVRLKGGLEIGDTDILREDERSEERLGRHIQESEKLKSDAGSLSETIVGQETIQNMLASNDLQKRHHETKEETQNGTLLNQASLLAMIPGNRMSKSLVASNGSTLEEIFDVYNPHRLARLWRNNPRQISEGCDSTMDKFLVELEKGTIWALKMTDATGRYTAGFFWGNSYWSGSATLCDATGNEAAPQLPSVPNGKSPFPLGFFRVRVEVNAMRNTTASRYIQMGLCLPLVCNGEDVREIMQLSASDDVPRSLKIVNIRTPHEYYDMTTDPTFWMLVAASTVAATMLIAGTAFDLYLKSEKAAFLCNNFVTYEVTKATGPKATNPNNINGDALNNNAIKEVNGNLPTFTGNKDTEAAICVPSTDETLGLFSKVLVAFSVRRNLNTICDRTVGSDTIPTIHGLRSISMVWVILGHTCIIVYKYSDNTAFRDLMETNILFQTVTNAAYSVDTFFFISGLLVSFLYFRTTAKVDFSKITNTTGFISSVIQFFGLLLYRFARLTVPYMFVLGCVEVVMKWFFFNSVFEAPALDHINCPKYWWRNILYINTLFPVKDMCMLWSWYLADDTQFYVLGAVLLILALRRFQLSAIMMVIFLVSSWCTTAYVAYSNNHMPSEDDPLALFDKIYDKPWTRLGPYLVGMSVGWILYKTDCKIKMTKVAVTLGWILSTAVLLSLLYGLYNAELSPVASAAYSSLSHTAWALGLAWVVIACSTGYGGYVTSILSMSVLYPFSRVTYCAYLIHPIAIRIMVMSIDSPMHLATNAVMVVFFGQVVFSYIVSFVISLAFEAPVVSLLRLLAPAKRKKVQ